MDLSLFIAAHEGDEIAGMVKGFGNVGCEVVFVSQDSEVLSKLKKMKRLSAIMLSSNIGIDVCKGVLAVKKKVPIYVMAEKGFDKNFFVKNGFNSFMQRPYHTPEILHEITKALSEKQGGAVSGFVQKSIADSKILKIILFVFIILFLIFLYINVIVPFFIHGTENG